MPRKKAVAAAGEEPKTKTRSPGPAKTTRAPRAAAAKTARRTTAATSKTAETKATREPGSNSSGPTRVRRAAPSRPSGNGNGTGMSPGQTARDYADAKRALGALWDDLAKQTYSTFDTITRRVEKSYADARKNITEGDVRYVLDKTQGKLKSIANSSSKTVANLGRQAKLLYEMLRDAMSGKFKMPWVTVAAITAALLYFVSPLDIIPDFIPGIGLIDDALVISLAVSMARVDLRRYIKENALDPADYGL